MTGPIMGDRSVAQTSGEAPVASTRRGGRHAIIFISVTAFLDVMALGVVLPVLPDLIREMAGDSASAGRWTGAMIALWAGMQFFCSATIGAVSDSYGRRPIILFSTAGLTVSWLLAAFAPNLGVLAASRALGGIASANLPAINAYIADTAPSQARARAYGLVGAAFSAGWIAGPAIGGVLGEFGARVPLWAAAGLSTMSFLYGMIVLPESLPRERRRSFRWARANPLGSLALLTARGRLCGLAGISFILFFSNYVFSTIFVLYAQSRFGFRIFEIGVILSLTGLMDMAVQGLLVDPVAKRIGNGRTMVLGLAAGTCALMLMAFTASSLIFITSLVLIALWGLASPTLQAMTTTLVPTDQQGQLQGALGSVSSAAGILAPPIFGWSYGLSHEVMPGLSFLIAGCMLAIATIGASILSARPGEVS